MEEQFNMRKIQEEVIFQAVKKESDVGTANRIVYGNREEQEDAAWVNGTMSRLEKNFTREKVKEIRMGCQCGYGMEEKIALVRELMKESSNLEEFANCEKARNAGLFSKDGELYLQFFFCPCPMLQKVKKLESKAWCQCTTGYSRQLFEKAWGCPVEVELLKSIKSGDDICLMKITPCKQIF